MPPGYAHLNKHPRGPGCARHVAGNTLTGGVAQCQAQCQDRPGWHCRRHYLPVTCPVTARRRMTWEERGMATRRRADHRPAGRSLRRDPHPGGARPASPALQRELGAAPRGAARRPRRRGRWSCRPGARSTSWPRTQAIRDDPDWRVARARARAGGPAGGDHRPDRPEDDHQRAELRRQGLAGRLRGREHAALGQHGHRPAQPHRTRSTAPSTSPARKARRTSCARTTSWPRSWSGRAAGTWTRSTCWSTASRSRAACSTSRCTSSTARSRQLDKGTGPYFYLPKIESHLEARLWNDAFNLRPGRAGHPARHDPGHRADRDHPGRVRDGGDPLRAARPLAPG